VTAQRTPEIPAEVPWSGVASPQAQHLGDSDARTAALVRIAALGVNPWPWGFLLAAVDEAALAGGELRAECDGVFPDGVPFSITRLSASLPPCEDGGKLCYAVTRWRDSEVLRLQPGAVATESSLPIARLCAVDGVWRPNADWSPPALLAGPEHPLRIEMSERLDALATLRDGLNATLRLPGAERRPAARVIGQVAISLAQGVGTMESLLACAALVPGQAGTEALKLAIAIRAAAGFFEAMPGPAWRPEDQRASLRKLLQTAEDVASGIGLPFRAAAFQPGNPTGVLVAEAVPGPLIFSIKAHNSADLDAACDWMEGAALAAPDRIHEAVSRRVAGCRRSPIDRDATIGLSSGPTLALYRVDDDFAWRAGQRRLALAAEQPAPENVSFSILISEV